MLGIVSGCAETSVSHRVDLDTELVDDQYGTQVQDYRTVADKMARSIVQLPLIQNAKTPPTVAFISVENRTSRYIDTEAFQEKIRTLLIKNAVGKVYFLDRKGMQDILKERKLKARGQATASEKSGHAIYGADYFLTGAIHSVNNVQGSERTEYLRYSFRLTDADTSLIVWEDDYESRYYKRKSMMDQ